jgi:hypothetical protein
MRNPKYLNQSGRPIDLPLRGKTSIHSLIEESQLVGSPTRTLRFLLKFQNVRKTGNGKYRLLRRSLNYKIPGLLPYEPNLEFLVDAARSCTRGIGQKAKSPEVFWQRADSLRLTSKQATDFLEFAEAKGMLFIHEINDWIDQRESANSGTSKRRKYKVGVGLFGAFRRA